MALNSSILNFDGADDDILATLFIAFAMVVEEKGEDVVIAALPVDTMLFGFFSLSVLDVVIVVGCFLNNMRSNNVTPLVDGADALFFFVVMLVVPPVVLSIIVFPVTLLPSVGMTLIPAGDILDDAGAVTMPDCCFAAGLLIDSETCFAVGLLIDLVSCFASDTCCC